MVSGGFNGGEDNGGSESLSKVTNAGKSAGKILGGGIKKAGKNGSKALGNAMQNFFKSAPKKIIIATVAGCLGLSGIFVLAFEATDQSSGEEKEYIDGNNNVSSGSGEVSSDDMSNANAACLAYYETLSKQKSVYQITSDGDLILASDSEAKTDYFKHDDEFYIDPNLLFAMNKYIFADTNYVLPELFLNPVYYDEDNLTLMQLTDDDGNLVCTSVKRDNSGSTTDEEITSVSDYGIASVLSYKTETMTEELKGTYVLKDVYNEETEEVEQQEISEPFSFTLSSEDYDVLDVAITMAGTITYNYSDTTVKSEAFVSGSSSDTETDNVYKILYDTITVTTYTVTDSDGNSYEFNSEEDYLSFIEENYGDTEETGEEDSGEDNENYTVSVLSKSYDLYKYRSSDSGIYTNFVDFTSADTEDSGNSYFYDYVTHFSAYTPVLTRTYDTLAEITSKASSDIYANVAAYGADGTTIVTGSGSTKFEQLYNGSMKETIETIWDGLLQWGYSEEQAAAILGNIAAESSYSTSVVNSIGAGGMCQWYKGRLTQLKSFASAMGTDWTDLTTQIQFACMELDLSNKYTYASCQWIRKTSDSRYKYTLTWQNSNDVAALAEAMAMSWERPYTESKYQRSTSAQKDISNRQKSAVAAYNTLHGQTFGHTIEIISGNGSSGTSTGSSSVSAATYTMSEKDREIFYDFYNTVDLNNIYNGDYTINYYTNFLTTDDADNVIILANSYIDGVSVDEATLSLSGVMWSSNFINDLSGEYDEGVTLASTLDGISVSSATELSDLDFLFPVDLSGYKRISSRFGHRNSPTAGASSDHKSIDISCASGTAIYATADGVVEIATYSASAGYYIVINHGTNANGEVVKTTYMHNSVLLVSAGDTVTRGQQISKSGSTGYSTGPHLDFRVTINGVCYNPLYVFGTTDVSALNNGSLTSFDISVDSSYLENLYYTETTGFVTP